MRRYLQLTVSATCIFLLYLLTGTKETGRIACPPEAGLTFNDKRPYVTVGTHIDNPTKFNSRVDRFGVRLHFEKGPRLFEIGSLQLGDPFVSRDGLLVQSGRCYQHTCPSEFTSGFSEHITIFSSLSPEHAEDGTGVLPQHVFQERHLSAKHP